MITYIRPNTKGYASERPVSFARVVKIDFDAMIYCLPLCFVIFSFSLLLFILRLTRHYFVQCRFPHFYCYFKIYIYISSVWTLCGGYFEMYLMISNSREIQLGFTSDRNYITYNSKFCTKFHRARTDSCS